MNLQLKTLPMNFQLLKLSIIESLTDRNKQQYSKAQTLKQSQRHHLESNHRQTPKPQPYVSNTTLTRSGKLYLVNSTGKNLLNTCQRISKYLHSRNTDKLARIFAESTNNCLENTSNHSGEGGNQQVEGRRV
jgi:hypothetical protein